MVDLKGLGASVKLVVQSTPHPLTSDVMSTPTIISQESPTLPYISVQPLKCKKLSIVIFGDRVGLNRAKGNP